MKKIALVLFSVIIFTSCEKEGQVTIKNSDIPLISKVLINGKTYMEYTYNEANLVTEEKKQVSLYDTLIQ